MSKYAVIEVGAKQERVAEGDILEVPKSFSLDSINPKILPLVSKSLPLLVLEINGVIKEINTVILKISENKKPTNSEVNPPAPRKIRLTKLFLGVVFNFSLSELSSLNGSDSVAVGAKFSEKASSEEVSKASSSSIVSK